MNKEKNEFEIEKALKFACSANFGSLSQNFMCQSVSAIEPNEAICLVCNDTLSIVIDTLKTNKTGCVQIVDKDDKLVGIFSERDWIIKVAPEQVSLDEKVELFMTANPMTIKMDATLAFAINLMSKGGFRHLPIIDNENVPVGMLSVKNIIDYLANEALEALLEF